MDIKIKNSQVGIFSKIYYYFCKKMKEIDINKILTDCIRKEILLFLKQSAESGNVIDQYRFGHYLRNSFYDDDDSLSMFGYKYIDSEIDEGKGADYWLRKAALAGNGEAQYELGVMYYEGSIHDEGYDDWCDIPEFEYNDAIFWLSKAANQGNAYALKALGDCYLQFNSISLGAAYIDGEKDEKKAFSYYQKAYEEKCDEALLGLGYCYEVGAGVQKNLEKAYELYSLAHNKGFDEATIKVIYCLLEGIGVQKQHDNAAFLLQRFMKSHTENDLERLKRYWPEYVNIIC